MNLRIEIIIELVGTAKPSPTRVNLRGLKFSFLGKGHVVTMQLTQNQLRLNSHSQYSLGKYTHNEAYLETITLEIS